MNATITPALVEAADQDRLAITYNPSHGYGVASVKAIQNALPPAGTETVFTPADIAAAMREVHNTSQDLDLVYAAATKELLRVKAARGQAA